MARFRDATLQDGGSVKASPLLRDAVAAQRMLLAATRALRFWRAAAAKAAARQRKESRPAASATVAPAAMTPVATVTPVPPPHVAPGAGVAAQTSGTRPAVPHVAPSRTDAGFLPGLGGPGLGQPRPGGYAGAAATAAFSYKAALRSGVAVSAL